MPALDQTCTSAASMVRIGAMSRKNYGFGAVYQRGKTWWIHFPFNGETIRESAKTDKKSDAEKLLKARLAQIHNRDYSGLAIERVLVSDLLDGLLRDYRLNQKSIDWAEIVVEKHLRPFFRYDKAHKVGTDRINAYIDARRAAGRANGTINRELSILRRSYNLGKESDPPRVAKTPKIPKLEENNVRRGFFESEQWAKLREQLPAEIRDVALFAYSTGCRRGEILKLRWEQIDLSHRIIVLEPGTTKNSEGRRIPMTDEMLGMLSERLAERSEFWPSSPWVFSRAGRPIKDFRTSWENACERAGLGKMLLHDMRRTGVRNLIRAGVPERVTMSISGHKTRAILDRYNIVSEADLTEAAERLQRYQAAKKEKK